MLIDSFLLIIVSFGIFGILLSISKEAFVFFETYFNKQILGTLSSDKSLNEFYDILIWAIEQLIVPISVVFILFWAGKNKLNKKLTKQNNKLSLVIILIALSGVLPIMISQKQRAFYLVPTLPLFAVGFAVFIQQKSAILATIFENKSVLFKIFKYSSVILVSVAIIVNISQIEHTNRDKKLQQDVRKIAEIIDENSSLTISKELYNNWSLHAYMMRYHRISLSSENEFDYKLISKKDTNEEQNYLPTNITLNNYQLLKHTEK